MCKAEHAKAVDKIIFPGLQGGPLMHVIAAKAVAFKGHVPWHSSGISSRWWPTPARWRRGWSIAATRSCRRNRYAPDVGESDQQGHHRKEADVALDASGIIVNKTPSLR